MTPYVEDEQDRFLFENDWQEIIATAESPRAGHFSNDVQEETLVGYIPFNKARSALRFFLQFAFADSDSPYRMYRENPHQHPEHPGLFAYDVSLTPYVPESNPDNESGEPFNTSPFGAGDRYARHQFLVATVRYRNFRCDFLEDDEVGDGEEWRRNTYFDLEPAQEALQVTGGMSQLTFAEGGGGAAPTAGTTRFGAPLAELLSKTAFTVNWLNVPWEYLSKSEFYFWPAKILACVGCVNAGEFLDDGLEPFPPGTCLMRPPRFSVKTFPVPDDSGRFPMRAVDLQIPFEYFDPPKGIEGSAFRGHNLMPWGGDGTAEKPGDGLFYYATRDGAATGDPLDDRTLIKARDFSGIFKHVNDPSNNP